MTYLRKNLNGHPLESAAAAEPREDGSVREHSASPRSDASITSRAAGILAGSMGVPSTVRVRVQNHTAILSGQVEWSFQRELAVRVVRDIAGVDRVEQQISLRARAPSDSPSQRVMKALALNKKIDASHIVVTITGSTAVLSGYVRSLFEKKQAGLATGASHDVTRIENRLAVRRHHSGSFRSHR
ncbi:BON domain-containing protein [Nesterenkonia sp. E16_7]|uniref:BON domain-containing protein n=1 Tax=unclassified Nesterenkonia TaxID=2629769 RepID=UPI001A927E37|nr:MULTISPECIES: BON domain-containing protein [unclassified Nesterenkonia]MBO0595880.1 BON domain-containing protein [Nesterenkonia sp. E16_10]MBO0599521.1 BON domain-containing protein [Nesterenkonia sp. E16_7]